MNKERKKHCASRYAEEDEAYWRSHQSALQESGLSRIVYCRNNNVNYDRFSHWLGKLSPHHKNSKSKPVLNLSHVDLVPARLKTTELSSTPATTAAVAPTLSSSAITATTKSSAATIALCTLNLKNGHALVIHDERALFCLLERWR